MALLNNRIIYSDDGTLSDLTVKMNNFISDTQSLTIVSAEDAIFVGSVLPFNHRYFDITTGNANAGTISVALWDGNAFTAAVDVIDQTLNAAGDTTLSQSGHISWVLDKNKTWNREDTEDMDSSGIETLRIFNKYWAKFTVSADTSATVFNFIGHKFAEDKDLGKRYPDLDQASVRTQFNNGVSGKNDWDEQHFLAAEIVIRDLMNRERIITADMLIRWDLMKDAAVHKLAEIIFHSQGPDSKEMRERAREYYKEAIEREDIWADQIKNTRLDLEELVNEHRFARV